MYRRAALDSLGWNEASRLEDYELNLRLSRFGPFLYGRRVLVCYRQHGWNTSRDWDLMADEVVASQRRAAGELGIGPDELRFAEASSRFLIAEYHLSRGQRTKALVRSLRSLRGAPSPLAVVRRVAYVFAPRPMVELYRRLRLRRTLSRYRGLAADLQGSPVRHPLSKAQAGRTV